MRILYLCHRMPYPPDKGDRIRAYHELKHLAQKHEIHLLTFADSAEEERQAKGLEGLCARVEVFRFRPFGRALRTVRQLLGSAPLTLAYFGSRQMEARVRELARTTRFDVVMAFCSSLAPYAELVPGVPRVLDMVDVDSAKWRELSGYRSFPISRLYALEATRLRRYETSLARSFDSVVVTTEEELRLLQEMSPAFHAAAVRNGIDLDFHRPLDFEKSPRPSLVFTGQMDYYPNVDAVTWFADEVFPALRERHPDLEFTIVGRSPTAKVWSLAKRPGINVTGAVGDIRPFLARSWTFVAPLRIARGVQNKVLEAMAAEVPVVCTAEVMRGLGDGGLRDGHEALMAANAAEFAQQVSRLLEDGGLRRRLGAAGRRGVAVRYSWSSNMAQLEELLVQCAGRGRNSAWKRRERAPEALPEAMPRASRA